MVKKEMLQISWLKVEAAFIVGSRAVLLPYGGFMFTLLGSLLEM